MAVYVCTDEELDVSCEELEVAVEAVARASALIRSRSYGRVEEKGDHDLATDVDHAIEATVREFLAVETPDVGFLGEEDGGGSGGVHWVLDPVDGTSNYVHALPLYAVSLALVDDEATRVGVIDLPVVGERYAAVAGAGAQRSGKRIAAAPTSRLRSATIAVGDGILGAHAEADRLSLARALLGEVERVRMLGSACVDLAWVACGRLDAAILPSNKPWDTAAGVLLAREAGAVVVDGSGQPHTPRSANTLAIAPQLLDSVLALTLP
ncbi:MAG TPA: inositol monophosphatase [Solirubrobacteraceae bacterium]